MRYTNDPLKLRSILRAPFKGYVISIIKFTYYSTIGDFRFYNLKNVKYNPSGYKIQTEVKYIKQGAPEKDRWWGKKKS